MGLRDRYLAAMQTRRAIASPGKGDAQRTNPLLRVAPPVPMQHATNAAADATSHATDAQHPDDLHGAKRATSDAAEAQQALAFRATSRQPVALRVLHEGEAEKSECIDLAAVAWTDADITAFLERRDRLMRWGWTEPDAEKQAEKLVKRDREADDRVSCIDCRHFRHGRCGNHGRAGLNSPELGRDLASLLQRCTGFACPVEGLR